MNKKLGQTLSVQRPFRQVLACPPGSTLAPNGSCTWPTSIKLFRPTSVFRGAPKR